MSINTPNEPINTTSAAPILFLGFNRPDLFERVVAAAGAGGRRKVLVSIDGPREGNASDIALCSEMRRIAESIPWAVDIQLKAENKNLGCGPAISSAISWALEQHPWIIIIEDDCLPDNSFLGLCDELLVRYRDDERVMQIAGTNWGASPERFMGNSYGFTSFAPIWGWATWRRAWQLYDYELKSWQRLKATRLHEGMAVSRRFRRLLAQDWDRVRDGRGTWDHQWQYAVLRNNGLSIIPRHNLVQNIGFRPDATQLQGGDRIFSRLPLENLDFPLQHPPEVIRNPGVESVFEKIYWQKLGWPSKLFRKLVRNPWLSKTIRAIWRDILPRPS